MKSRCTQADVMPILPTSPRLIEMVRTTLDQIVKTETLTRASQNQLRVIDAVLAELSRREDGGAYREGYKSGLDLLLRHPTAVSLADDLPHALPSIGFDSNALGKLAVKLSDAVRLNAADQKFALSAIQWEANLYEGRMTSAAPKAVQPTEAINIAALEPYLADRNMRLRSFHRIIGGFQKETILLSVVVDGEEKDLVLRAEKPDRFVKLDASDIVDEYPIAQTIHGHGVACAKPLWLEPDASVAGARFMVSERIAGRTPSDSLTPQALSQTELQSLAETLADLHAIPAEAFREACIGHWLNHSTLAENTRAAVSTWRKQLWAELMTASPTAAYLQEWLAQNAPQRDEAPVLLHVDYGPHNLILNEGRVAAVLDWESVRLGDRAEDMSYLLLYLGERADRDQMLRWYQERAGVQIPDTVLRYFDVYNTIKMVMGSAFASALAQHNQHAAIEWCHIGLFTIYLGITGAQTALSRAL